MNSSQIHPAQRGKNSNNPWSVRIFLCLLLLLLSILTLSEDQQNKAAAGKRGASLNLTLFKPRCSTGVQMFSALIPLFFLSAFTVVFDINGQLHYTLKLVELTNAQVLFFFLPFPPFFLLSGLSQTPCPFCPLTQLSLLLFWLP